MKTIISNLKKLNISENDFELYGNDIAKIKSESFANLPKKGKLILMTSINPTAAGEGKTTTAIGLADGINFLKKKAILALREPSLGPVFGRKGTANGGGESVVLPEDKINLHFTGDLHAISTANNLISAAIDNEIYWKTGLQIDPNKVLWKRTIDLNDRSLRNVELTIAKNLVRKENFTITAASQMMTIVTLASSIDDLKKRLDQVVVAYNFEGKPVFLKELQIIGSILALLKEAVKPNFVLSKYQTPTLVHCGPFANISIGTNSIVSTNLALKLSDYVVVESGFGSDLGFEKFMNLVNFQHELIPDCVVMVVTLRALNLHNDFENGFKHLEQHLKHVILYNLNLVVGINAIEGDDPKQLTQLQKWLTENNYLWAMNEAYTKGPNGAVQLGKTVINACARPFNFKPLLKYSDSIKEKIIKIINNFYYLSDIDFQVEAITKINELQNSNYNKWPICLVKSQNSIDGNDGKSENYKLKIKDVEINYGGQFILAYTNEVFSMPGLNKEPNYRGINLEDDNVIGLK